MTYIEILTALISIVALLISLTAAYYSRRQAKAAELQAMAAFAPIEKEMHTKMNEFLFDLADQPISALARSDDFFRLEIGPINSGATSIGRVIEEGRGKILSFQERYFKLQSLIEKGEMREQGLHLQRSRMLLDEVRKFSITLQNQINDARKISATRK